MASVLGLAAVRAPPSAIAAAKANASKLYQKAGNAASSLMEAAPDLVKVMVRMLPDFTAAAGSMTKAVAAGEKVADKPRGGACERQSGEALAGRKAGKTPSAEELAQIKNLDAGMKQANQAFDNARQVPNMGGLLRRVLDPK